MAAPADKVQLHKQESSAGGGDPADADDFSILAEVLDPNEDAPEVQGVFFQPPSPSTVSDKLVYATRDSSGNLIFRDDFDGTERTLSTLLTGGTGITPAEHEAIDSLVHSLAEDFHEEIVRTAGKVSRVTHWTDGTKTTKIRETRITRSGGKVSSVVNEQYDGAGTLIVGQTLTETINRSGGKVVSIDGVES